MLMNWAESTGQYLPIELIFIHTIFPDREVNNNAHLIQSHSSPRRQGNHCNDDTVSWRPTNKLFT